MNQFSTLDAIEELGASREARDPLIEQMIYAYYANYVEGEGPYKTLSLAEMKEIYRESQELLESFQAYCEFARKTSSPNEKPDQEQVTSEFHSQLLPDKKTLWKNIYPVRYQLRMLGDIGATLLMVSEIVSQHVSPSNFEDNFFGVDLGTGTGILLASQEVLARRNGFKHRDLHGIEMDSEVASKTRGFCQKLGYTIHEGDTTNIQTWLQIPAQPLTCVTNENIPAADERMHREPFFENMCVLWENRSNDIQPHTVFVPRELEVIKDPATTRELVSYVCNPENGFYPRELDRDARAFERADLGSLYEHLIPYKMKLGDQSIPLKLISQMGAQRLGDFGYKRSFMSRF